MNAFPIASSAQGAMAPDAPLARTAEAARLRAGGPVFLAAEEAPQGFLSVAEAEAAFPGLYGDGRFELAWRDNAWRVIVRYWRLQPPTPVARNATSAARRPIGTARTPDEARAVLGGPAELVGEALPRLYRTFGRARNVWRERIDTGLARLEQREGGFAVVIQYWQPITAPGTAAPLAQSERDELRERAAAPLRGLGPQADPYIGMFERLAPENPVIILAEEGDGRTHGD